MMQSNPRSARVVIGADFIGHVGAGNRGDADVMGRLGTQARNAEGLGKNNENSSGEVKVNNKSTRVDDIWSRRCNLREISDCKVAWCVG